MIGVALVLLGQEFDMIDTVKATTVTLAETGDAHMGLDQWALLVICVIGVGAILLIGGFFTKDSGLGSFGGLVICFGSIGLFVLGGIYDSRAATDLQNRQEAALEEQLSFSDAQVTADGDFVAADSDGQHVSGLLVEKDGLEYYVIIEDKS